MIQICNNQVLYIWFVSKSNQLFCTCMQSNYFAVKSAKLLRYIRKSAALHAAFNNCDVKGFSRDGGRKSKYKFPINKVVFMVLNKNLLITYCY